MRGPHEQARLVTEDRVRAEPPEDVLLARAYLNRVAEPASIPVWDWVRRHGPVVAAANIRSGDVDDAVAAATTARRMRVDPEEDLAAAQRHGIRFVVPESSDWPHFAFAALEAAGRRRLAAYRAGERTHREGGEPIPPLALWARGSGDLATSAVRSVAMVGARAATSYGEHVTAELGYGLARRQIVIVSGGAYGIDAAAHRAALAADGLTVIVSAGGLDRPYPASHRDLYDRVAEHGLLLSESPPGCAPHRVRFLTRNRLIAALATGTLIVEAGARSGALNTARHAQTLGRPVMAVPGPVTSAMSVGCHNLLRTDRFDGSEPRPTPAAVLVTSVDDVINVVGSVGESADAAVDLGAASGRGTTGAFPTPGGEPRPGDGALDATVRTRLDGLDSLARRVFDGLPARAAAQEDELAARSGVSPTEVLRAVPMLELAGLIDSCADGYRISPNVRRALVPPRRPAP
jgi:DNA processing protein